MIRPMGGLGATCSSGTAFDTGRGYAICMDDESSTPTGEIVPTTPAATGSTPPAKQASMLGTVNLGLDSPIVIAAIVGLAFVLLSRR